MKEAEMKDSLELEILIKASIATFNAMPPAERREHLRAQRISWVYGNLAISNPNITREMVEQAAEKEGW